MCENCFKDEIKYFLTKEEWDQFDLDLTRKLGSGKLKQVGFKPDRERDKDDGVYFYQCHSCGQKWMLKDALFDLEGAYLLRNVSPY